MADFLLFSGTSNPELARAIASELHMPLSGVDITRFIDNECRVHVTQEDVKDKDVYVIQSLSQIADQNLVELCLLGQALKGLGAKRVGAVIPWMGYSKQDKAFRRGEAVSANLVARFIEAAGFDHVITMELHSENVIPFFRIPVKELSSHSVLINYLGTHNVLKDLSSTVVVSPDLGGEARSKRFADEVNLSMVYLDKTRDLSTGKVEMTNISEAVEGHITVIFDDIINTGSTAIKAGEFLMNKGAKAVYFLATHAVLAGDACEKLSKSPLDTIVVTDTIAVSKEKQFPKLKIVTVAPLIAAAIQKSAAS